PEFKGESLQINASGNLTVYRRYFKNYNGYPGKVLNVLRYIIFQFALYRKIKQEHGVPSIAHVHVMARSSILAHWLQRTKKVPFIVSEHWGGYYPESGKLSGFKKKIYAFLLNRADGISAVSDSLAKAIKNIGVKKDIVVIPNVINPVFLATSFKDAPADRINIIHISTLVKEIKRVDVIIETLEIVSRDYREIYLTVVGDGPDRKSLKDLARHQKNMKNKIRFTGDIEQEDIALLLQESHFSVSFSKYETQSIVLIESIAMGVPVVAPEVGGIPEHFNDKGIIFEADSDKELERAIRKMISGKNDFDKNEMREYARKHFSHQIVNEQFADLYESIAIKSNA
ncbi:MAG TPA: hypothetical protein DCX54_11515, partial [Flavobacteriales bacterium]|nr:hypothetical protein [Flavobacteriales bacterium]